MVIKRENGILQERSCEHGVYVTWQTRLNVTDLWSLPANLQTGKNELIKKMIYCPSLLNFDGARHINVVALLMLN